MNKSSKGVKKVEEKYCSYCGEKLIKSLVGAETSDESIMVCGEIVHFPFAAYDTETGERNYCNKYTCPHIKVKKWYQIFSPHDEFTINWIVTPYPLKDIKK